MIINRKDAVAAWDFLRTYARVADEVYDDPHMAVLDGRTADQVNAAYRIAARYTHPDKGGDAETFARVDYAKCLLIKWLERQEEPRTADFADGLCKQCDGLGFHKVTHGFKTTRRACQACRGTGDMNYEHEKGGD